MKTPEMGPSPEQKEKEPITVEDFCKKLSSAEIRECIGFGGIAAILPHRLPDSLPKDWPKLKEGVSTIEADELEELEGYQYEGRDDQDENEYATVSPIPGVEGLVFYGGFTFIKFGEKGITPVVFEDDGTAIELNVKNDGSVEEGNKIPLRWNEEIGKYEVVK